MNIKNYIIGKQKLVNKALDRYLPSLKVKPRILHKAVRYAVFSGGKRIRPILTLACFEVCGGRVKSIMPVACAIELIHAYTLIHDDLPCMDNDTYRRGKLTCHKKFNEGIALLAGDALLTNAFELLADAGNIDVIKDISRAIGSRGTVGGQAVDISVKSKKRDMNYINDKKTAVLFETAARSAGIFNRADRKKIDALGSFGRFLGLTFQLVDDLMDKDGYVRLYGEKYVRDKVFFLTKKAKDSLFIFGGKADKLKAIADFILHRGM